MDRFARMTSDDFDAILAEIMNQAPASSLLSIPGVYECVAEHYNNEVLARWDRDNPSDHCEGCREMEHDACPMVDGCPCCEDSRRK